MPQQQVKSPSQINLTTASPVPNPSWAPDKRFAQASLESWPATNEVLDKTGLPFGIVFHPLAETGTVLFPLPFKPISFSNLFLFFKKSKKGGSSYQFWRV